MIEKIEAVVLSSLKFGDSSKIVHVYSKEFGKLLLLAKGALKSKSKFAGCLETLSHIEAKVYFKQNKDLQTLSDTEIIKNRALIQANPDTLALSYILSELISKTQREGEINIELFDDYILFLDNLNNFDNYYFYSIKLMLKIIAYSGYSIGNNIGEGNYFSTKKGKFYLEGPNSHYLDNNLCNNFKSILNDKNIKLNKVEFRIIFDFLHKYLSYHLDREININSLYLID